MACGRWDLEVSSRAHWMRQLGADVSDAELDRMHPLRSAMRPPPPKPEAVRQAESKAGWKLIGTHLAKLAKKHKPQPQPQPPTAE